MGRSEIPAGSKPRDLGEARVVLEHWCRPRINVGGVWYDAPHEDAAYLAQAIEWMIDLKVAELRTEILYPTEVRAPGAPSV